jgi:ADP-ribosylation factor-like protein 2
MGLLTILKKLKAKEKQVRILILGLDNAGKTTILQRINGEDYLKIQPTLGFNIKTIEHKGYKLNVWDVGGQSSIRSYWRNYFEQTDGLIFVIDSVDQQRMELAAKELHSLLKEERLQGASLLIYANKQDLEGAIAIKQIASIMRLEDIKTHHWSIQKCSAMSGLNLLAGMDWLVDDISSRLFSMD